MRNWSPLPALFLRNRSSLFQIRSACTHLASQTRDNGGRARLARLTIRRATAPLRRKNRPRVKELLRKNIFGRLQKSSLLASTRSLAACPRCFFSRASSHKFAEKLAPPGARANALPLRITLTKKAADKRRLARRSKNSHEYVASILHVSMSSA